MVNKGALLCWVVIRLLRVLQIFCGFNKKEGGISECKK
jgi:hypothetical protein